MKTALSKLQNHRLAYESLPEDVPFIWMLREFRKDREARRARRQLRATARAVERKERDRTFYEVEV